MVGTVFFGASSFNSGVTRPLDDGVVGPFAAAASFFMSKTEPSGRVSLMAFEVRGVKEDADPDKPNGDWPAPEGVKDEVFGREGREGVDGIEVTETFEGVG